MGVIRKQDVPHQFWAVDDLKLRMTVTAMADKYSEQVRELIYRTYQDDKLASIYRQIRSSGIYKEGGKSKVYQKIVEFPNGWVYDFCDAIMKELYGPEWMKSPKALKHELIRPWRVIE